MGTEVKGRFARDLREGLQLVETDRIGRLEAAGHRGDEAGGGVCRTGDFEKMQPLSLVGTDVLGCSG